jgi:ribonuclease P protein component
MLPNKYRLTGKVSFEETKNKGTVFQSESFGVLVYNRKDKEKSRLGFVISTKISKKAADRNRIKRLLRKSTENLLDDLKDGYNILFLAKRNILGKNLNLLAKEVGETFKKAELIK